MAKSVIVVSVVVLKYVNAKQETIKSTNYIHYLIRLTILQKLDGRSQQ